MIAGPATVARLSLSSLNSKGVLSVRAFAVPAKDASPASGTAVLGAPLDPDSDLRLD
jgi:hypothetical protein